MAEHFCTEHATKFTRKTKDGKEWFSHPIKDRDGETAGWCNEKKDQESYHDPNPPTQTTTEPSDKMSKEDWADKDTKTRKSIERQKALGCAVSFASAKIQAGVDLKADAVEKVAILFEHYIEFGATQKK